MTPSNGNIFRVTGPLWGEFTGEFPSQRPVTRSFDVYFYLCLNNQLSNKSWQRWFEMPSHSLWCHCNVSAWVFYVKFLLSSHEALVRRKWPARISSVWQVVGFWIDLSDDATRQHRQMLRINSAACFSPAEKCCPETLFTKWWDRKHVPSSVRRIVT